MDGLIQNLERVERGVLKSTYDQIDVVVDSAGRLQGEATVQGVVANAAPEIPFLLHPGFTIHKLGVNGGAIAPTQEGAVLYVVNLLGSVARGTELSIKVLYSGEYTLGSRTTAAGHRWYEFNLNTLWRPLFSLDVRDGAKFRVSALLPGSLRVVAAMAESSRCTATGSSTECSWDTGPAHSMDFAFVAGEGEFAERSTGGIDLKALTPRGVPYRPDDVLDTAWDILSFYGSLWGPCPFPQLALACPPGSATGNCVREGLVIAGTIGHKGLDSAFGVLAHEIAHMWWGIGTRFDSTRPGCEEGLAAYSRLLAHRHRFGKDALRKLLAERYLPWAKEAEAHGTALFDCTLTMPHSEALRDGKGACVFLLLEQTIGEEIMAYTAP